MLCAFYHSTGRQLPQQFLTMASCIPIEYLGKLERKDAVARGLGFTVSMQQCVKTHWVDLMSQIKSDPNFANQLHAAFCQICPEHKEKISDWKTLLPMCERWMPESHAIVVDFMNKEGMHSPPFPEKWLTKFLLRARRGAKQRRTARSVETVLTEEEQPVAIKRLLHHLKELSEGETAPLPLHHHSFDTLIGKHVSEKEQNMIVGTTQKFFIGLRSAADFHRRNYDSLVEVYTTGRFDNEIRNSCSEFVGEVAKY